MIPQLQSLVSNTLPVAFKPLLARQSALNGQAMITTLHKLRTDTRKANMGLTELLREVHTLQCTLEAQLRRQRPQQALGNAVHAGHSTHHRDKPRLPLRPLCVPAGNFMQ